MFNLEQSIANWRRQMLATGIKTPVPMEELEIHLREEIEQQMKSGLSGQDAFEISIRQIGQPKRLNNEFEKSERKHMKRTTIILLGVFDVLLGPAFFLPALAKHNREGVSGSEVVVQMMLGIIFTLVGVGMTVYGLMLKTEFTKAGGLLDWLGENKSVRTNRILGALWVAYCSWMLLTIAPLILVGVYAPSFSLAASVISGIFVVLYIYLRGVIGGVRLFRGITRDRRMIRLLALLNLIGCLALLNLIESFVQQFNALKTVSVFVVASALFSLVSIWFLRPPQKPELTTR
jgi:hypothetical protein